jgi:gas vesicle protein GvpO
MAQGARARPNRESSGATAREAAELARQYIAEMTDREPVQMTSVSPTEDGWLVEVEIIEDRRIPSSSDILALYEVELDANGELLAYHRIRRYLRGQTGNGGSGA